MKTIRFFLIYAIFILTYIFISGFEPDEPIHITVWLSIIYFILLLIILLLSASIYLGEKKRVKIREEEDKTIRNDEQNAVLQRLAEEQLQGTTTDIRNVPVNDRWELLKNRINQVHNHFTLRLVTQHPMLKEEEIRLCCLIRIGMNTQWIIQYLNISKEYFRKKKSLLAKTLHVQNSNKHLEEYIHCF